MTIDELTVGDLAFRIYAANCQDIDPEEAFFLAKRFISALAEEENGLLTVEELLNDPLDPYFRG